MATKKAKARKREEDRFLSAVRVAAREHPEGAKAFGIARVAPKPKNRDARCVKWGRNPKTGERVCLKWK